MADTRFALQYDRGRSAEGWRRVSVVGTDDRGRLFRTLRSRSGGLQGLVHTHVTASSAAMPIFEACILFGLQDVDARLSSAALSSA